MVNTAYDAKNREPRFYVSVIYNGADWIDKENGKPAKAVGLFLQEIAGNKVLMTILQRDI